MFVDGLPKMSQRCGANTSLVLKELGRYKENFGLAGFLSWYINNDQDYPHLKGVPRSLVACGESRYIRVRRWKLPLVFIDRLTNA
jgi:hypothetical protein